MKNRERMESDARQRKKEIARKTRGMGVKECGNVPSSFGRSNKEFLICMGFYVKGETNGPSKTAWAEKRLRKDLIEIDVRKNKV